MECLSKNWVAKRHPGKSGTTAPGGFTLIEIISAGPDGSSGNPGERPNDTGLFEIPFTGAITVGNSVNISLNAGGSAGTFVME